MTRRCERSRPQLPRARTKSCPWKSTREGVFRRGRSDRAPPNSGLGCSKKTLSVSIGLVSIGMSQGAKSEAHSSTASWQNLREHAGSGKNTCMTFSAGRSRANPRPARPVLRVERSVTPVIRSTLAWLAGPPMGGVRTRQKPDRNGTPLWFDRAVDHLAAEVEPRAFQRKVT